jgi:hypothetical protein
MSDTKQAAKTALVVGPCIISFPNLFVPKAVMGQGEPTYGCTLLFDPKINADDLRRIQAACEAAADKVWPPRGGDDDWRPKRGLKDDAIFHWPLTDGNRKSERAGYAGKIYINARTKQRPGVVDQALQRILDDTLIYPGAFVNASISFFAYSRPRMGVGCGLNNIQFVRDGTRLGGRTAPEDDFTPIAVEREVADAWLA